MKYILFSLIPLMMSFQSHALVDVACVDKLLNHPSGAGRYDSASFQLLYEEWSGPTYASDHLAQAVVVVRKLVDKVGCSPNSINFGDGPEGRAKSRCERLYHPRSNSLTCYIETNLGYFFVTYDYLDSANIVYNRWD